MNVKTPTAAVARVTRAADRYAPDASEVLDALSIRVGASNVMTFDGRQLDDLGITGSFPLQPGLPEQDQEDLLLDDLGITGARVLDARRQERGRRASVRTAEGIARTDAMLFALEELDALDPLSVPTPTGWCIRVEGALLTEHAA